MLLRGSMRLSRRIRRFHFYGFFGIDTMGRHLFFLALKERVGSSFEQRIFRCSIIMDVVTGGGLVFYVKSAKVEVTSCANRCDIHSHPTQNLQYNTMAR